MLIQICEKRGKISQFSHNYGKTFTATLPMNSYTKKSTTQTCGRFLLIQKFYSSGCCGTTISTAMLAPGLSSPDASLAATAS